MNPAAPYHDNDSSTAGPGPSSMAYHANFAQSLPQDDMYRLPDVPTHFQTAPVATNGILVIDPSLADGLAAVDGAAAPPPRKRRRTSPAQPTKRKKQVETTVEVGEDSEEEDGDGAGSSPAASGRARSVSLAASTTKGKGGGKSASKNALKIKLPKGVEAPPIPSMFQGHANLGKLLDSVKQVVVAGGGEARVFEGEGEDVMTKEQLDELERATDPDLIIKLLADLAQQRETLDKAYEALNNELFKAQIEQSVLQNVQALLVEHREMLRKAQTG
ncbi:hypothetical protein Rt10032_c14g5322 [Rhodotorula toruloides]|uniref:Uncharacterized protein n=1 Tax=Rhodotorula toruloides TaxID=5286 RepID=A0A511KN28_RHOTO|nr:hypothetical protein Rt10032_c14g5322 [Rhodotorula toruloides]